MKRNLYRETDQWKTRVERTESTFWVRGSENRASLLSPSCESTDLFQLNPQGQVGLYGMAQELRVDYMKIWFSIEILHTTKLSSCEIKP